MSQVLLNETASIATPAAGKVGVYADTTANPQLKFVDDAGNVRTVADNNNTVTMANKTLTSPVINGGTGTSLAMTSTITSSGGGVGYATGAGGTVTQLTSQSTGVTLSKFSGDITMVSAALAANTAVSFTLTNTQIAAGDNLLLNHISGGTIGAYMLNASGTAAGSRVITVRNLTAGSLTEAPVIRFTVLKGVTA